MAANDSAGFRTYDASICIMTRVLQMMSGRWKPIILYLIRNDVNRFGMMQRSMPRISKKILTEQLRELEADKLITRHVVRLQYPQIVEYRLTDSGKSLRSLIDQLVDWGFRNFQQEYSDEMVGDFLEKKSIAEVEEKESAGL